MIAGRPSRRALYLQVRDALAARIARGEWKPGFALPNEVDLAREFSVSAGTVRKALELMEEGRLITRRQGKGSFVNDQTSESVAARLNNILGPDGERVSGTTAPAATIGEGSANEQEGARLHLRVADPVYRIYRLRRDQHRAFMVENVTLPAALFPDLCAKEAIADDISGLAQYYGILLGKAEERVSVVEPPVAVANALGITPGTPLMLLDRVVFMLDGRPIEWRLGYCCLHGGCYLAQMR